MPSLSNLLSEMKRDARENGVHYTNFNIENLLNPEGEENVLEDVTIEELYRTVGGVSEPDTNSGEEDGANKF